MILPSRDVGLSSSEPNRQFATSLARAFGGALIFSLPLLMTMEMWWLGFYMNRARLALLIILLIPLLIRLSYHAGFEETFDWKNDVVDAFVALAVGFASSAFFLYVLGILSQDVSMDSAIGMVSLQAVPASLGAMLAQSQMGKTQDQSGEEKPITYWGELFLMIVGSLFLAFNVAPTEEIVMIAHQMTEWQAFGIGVLSLLLMHAFVYAVEFQGQEAALPSGTPQWSVVLRFTVVGYAIALLISAYVLWTFGRTDGLPLREIVMISLVLAFPASIGAAAARLIL